MADDDWAKAVDAQEDGKLSDKVYAGLGRAWVNGNNNPLCVMYTVECSVGLALARLAKYQDPT